ncbi:MAG: D-glycerate dehydrogenase [Chloroflexi bacterium]|nr:D-glycerate dehydrogenase [Chloroflexota bacterium]
MVKPRVYVTRVIPDAGLERIRAVADAEVWEGDEPPPYEILLEKVEGLDGLVSLLTDRIDAELMDAAGGSLRVISQMAVGTDNIDLAAATERGIPVGNTPGVLTETTADFAFSLLMAAARRIVEGERYVKAGKWVTWGPTLLMGHDIHGATLGLIGFGRIGQGMAKRARGFGMRVLYAGPSVDEGTARELHAERRDLDELLTESDFVSLHVPLTEQTTHLMADREFKLMKPGAILINTARGPVVDPGALYRALKEGEIAYAALDVTEPEPIPVDDPLLTLDNCLIVPHIASSSLATRSRMATMAAENLEAGLKGEKLPHCANPEVYG